jgi:hypothetical protein
LHEEEKGAIYGLSLKLDSQTTEYTHIKYGFADFLSGVGGVTELIIFLFGIFLYPLSQNSFLLKAIKKLYTARTRSFMLL